MAYSLNRAQLIGNLGQDPELRSTPQGSSVCTLSIATTESYKDKASGEWKETTEWHKVVLWDKLAESAAQYLKKGSKVFIEGKIKTRNYDDKDNVKRYVTEILGLTMIMMGGKSSGGVSEGDAPYDSQTSASEEDDVPF
jgi:single-strand DNA-binding protein